MKLVVMGTGSFAVPMFESLLDSRHEVPALITRPTPPAGGRRKSSPNPMRDVAERIVPALSRADAERMKGTIGGELSLLQEHPRLRHRLKVYAPESVNSSEGHEILRALQPDLYVVCDYGEILSPETLALARFGGINLHASLLPKYRGAAPIHWALLNGDTETGVTVIHMTPRLDAGPILAFDRTPIGWDETQPELEARLAVLGVAPVHFAITAIAAGEGTSPLARPQDPSQTTKARRLKGRDGAINWSKSAEQIRNQVRALKPWPGTYTYWRRTGLEPLRILIDGVAVVGQPGPLPPNVLPIAKPPAQSLATNACAPLPGQVVSSAGKELQVATGDGTLSILKLQPAGKLCMTAEEFLRGYRLREGDVLVPQ